MAAGNRSTAFRMAGSILVITLFLTVFFIIEILRVKNEQAQAIDENYIFAQTEVKKQIYYTACSHLEVETITGDPSFCDKNFDALEKEGWYVFWAENGQVIAFRESPFLCNADSAKSYLAIHQGRLALFKGPLGSSKTPVEYINIDLKKLPENWQKQLSDGGIEFDNDDALLSALENMDEL